MPAQLTDQQNQLDIRFYSEPPRNLLEITSHTHYFGPTATVFFLLCAQHRATGAEGLDITRTQLARQLGVAASKIDGMLRRLERLGGIRRNGASIEITRFPRTTTEYT